MKYLKEFKDELDQMLNDVRVMSKYTKVEVYDTLYEYWSNKDKEINSSIFRPEVYDNINKEFQDYMKLDSKHKKIYFQLLMKKLKYKR